MKDGAVLPANAAGVPASGWNRREPDWDRLATFFSVYDLADPTRPVPFKLRHSEPDSNNPIFLIRPEGFAPDKFYRLVYLHPDDETHWADSVEVQVGHAALPADLGLGLETRETWGSYSHGEIAQHEIHWKVNLPPELERFRDTLFYFSYVDGKRWTSGHPERPFDCIGPGFGRSDSGVGQDVFYTRCRKDVFWTPRRDGVTPGERRLEMVAWLPGTEIRYRVTRDVELRCPDQPELRDVDAVVDDEASGHGAPAQETAAEAASGTAGTTNERMSIANLSGWTLTLIFLGLSVLHWYWVAFGLGKLDRFVPEIDGRPAFRPGRISTSLVALLLLAATLICASEASLLGVPRLPLARAGVWTLALLFLLRAVGEFRLVGFFKRVRGTRFADLDTRIFSPLCLVISVLCAVLLWARPV